MSVVNISFKISSARLSGFYARFVLRKNSKGEMEMNKRLGAAFVVMLFMLGAFAAPVSAHFTLGEFTGTYRFRQKDYDPHVAGVIGYVWPGVGYAPDAAPGAGKYPLWAPQYPGYQPPYPGWNPGTKGGTYPPGSYQVDSNLYAPFGAILTSTIVAGTPFVNTWWGNPTIEGISSEKVEHKSTGDLLFGFNATSGFWHNYTEVFLFVPPEFTGIEAKKVVASWTNNYDQIQVKKADIDRNLYYHQDGYVDYWGSMYGPGWTIVRIQADRGRYRNETQKDPIKGSGIFYYPHCMNFSVVGKEWYYLRLNEVTAPTIAGRYFFKVGFREPNYTKVSNTQWDDFAHYGNLLYYWMPIQNWPVLTVKGEVDPAIITGTIRYGGWNQTLYGNAVKLSGRVRAVGIADDPYTGKSTGRPVEARGYFNQTANGHYEVEGLAPGVYDIYASCAGYPEQKIAASVKILKGQSYHIDGYLIPGAVIHGQVFSKCGTGEVAWGSALDMKIEIYAAAKTDAGKVAAVLPASRNTPAVSWSPWGSKSIQFPWYWTPGDYANGAVRGLDPYGVGPRQAWQTVATATSFIWQFGERGKYGAPCDWTGHVPEINATWVNGLGPGVYYVRAWARGYVQTAADGVTFEHASFTIASIEWPGDIYVPFDLRKGSSIKKFIHFHDVPGTLVEKYQDQLPISGFYTTYPYAPNRGLRVRVYVKDAAGTTWGYTGSVYTDYTKHTVFYVTIPGRESQASYAGRNYGFPAGDYKVEDYVEGFLMDPKPQWVSLGLCGTTVELSNHVYRGVRFNITLYSKDWQHPTVDVPWKYHNEIVWVGLYKDGKLVGITYAITNNTSGTHDSGKARLLNITDWDSDFKWVASTAESYAWDTGLYEFRAFGYGYVLKKPSTVYATRGALADIPIKLTRGAQVPVTMKFKWEGIFDDLTYNSSMRVRLFDDKDGLVAEYLTSDPWHGLIDYTAPTLATAQIGAKGPDAIYDNDLNYVPGGTATLQFELCGLPDLYNWWYGYSADPAFDFGWYDPTGMIAKMLISAPYGIDAEPNYKGGWRVEVDVVPWYTWKYFYPPLPGELYGESPKYIPANKFGPWELRSKVTVPSNHLGGEASIYFELDLRGLATGMVTGYTWCDDWRPTSWTTVQFTAADGKVYSYPTLDGQYAAWLPMGQYSMAVIYWSPAGQGYKTYTAPLYVSDGGVGVLNAHLEQSGVPIPEFPVAATVLAFVLAASLVILRRRKRQ